MVVEEVVVVVVVVEVVVVAVAVVYIVVVESNQNVCDCIHEDWLGRHNIINEIHRLSPPV